jgi:hypothetical protein
VTSYQDSENRGSRGQEVHAFQAFESPKPREEIRLRSYENWSHGLGHSQEGLRREKPYREIGKSEIGDSRGQRTLDIRDQETPNPESISFLLRKRQRSECRGP